MTLAICFRAKTNRFDSRRRRLFATSRSEMGIKMEFEVRYSRRKTVAIEITREAKVLIRAPYRMSVNEINRFVEKHMDWIAIHRQKAFKRLEEAEKDEKLDENQIRKLAEQAAAVIPGRVAYFAGQMNVSYGRITIRNQKTRWGSCSSKGNLNFNCLLMLVPSEVLDYVVIHELCHRKEMNHSVRFWHEVEKVLPGYREQEKWLKEHGGRIMERANMT